MGGLSKGAIYHHFKSKDDILMAVTRWYVCQDVKPFPLPHEASRISFRRLSDEVKNGRRYIIFPEGGYDHNKNELQDFMAGRQRPV